jgi:hypothetical protein
MTPDRGGHILVSFEYFRSNVAEYDHNIGEELPILCRKVQKPPKGLQ